MLRSLPHDVEAIVVDNASTDGSPEIAQAARPDAVVVRLPNNQGFGHGCNVGAGVASRDVLIFLNPDGRVIGDALAVLAAHVSAEPHGRSAARRSSMRMEARVMTFVADHSLITRRSSCCPPRSAGRPRDFGATFPTVTLATPRGVRWTTCRAPAWPSIGSSSTELGGFDEDFFLYSEEETLCEAARAAGGQCIYLPEAVIEHVGGTSTGRVSEFAVHHFYRSRVIFYRKRYGWLGGLVVAAPSAPAC